MKRPVVWVGRAVTVLGLAAVIAAVLHAWPWALIAAIGGFLAATGLAFAPLVRVWLAARPLSRPSDFAHIMDLLRRAHGGRAGWAVGLPDSEVVEVGEEGIGKALRRRGEALVQLASSDGRAHVEREPAGTYVAVGDFPFAAGLLLARPDATPTQVEAVVEELRRLVAGMRVTGQPEHGEPGQRVAKQLAAIAGGAQTLEGVAKAGVELAQQLTQRGAVIVLQGAEAAQALRVLAVSRAADQRLVALTVPDDAPVARAIHSGLRVVSHGEQDVFGAAVADRRRQDRAGTAHPLMDGHFAIGALVITGPPAPPDDRLAELDRLVLELGSRLAAARAVHAAEERAVVDALTGLRNRRELESRLSRLRFLDEPPQTSLIYLDLDRFKALNDALGHAAGDSALRHVAGILQAAVRDKDLAARIGGEEFAVWMPDTPLAEGVEVAERIRRAVESTAWRWNGTPYAMTASCGVAAYPDSVGDVNNLRSAADAALYRAKEAGRNRVEKAIASG